MSAAGAFSESLLRIHAAADPAALEAVGREEEKRHAVTCWFVELLREHVRVRREQLQTPAPRRSADTLTPREREVLQRIARGETDAAAARALGIAPRTVSKHVENILRKLGAETRTAAALQARSGA